jgi:hypothetical protein
VIIGLIIPGVNKFLEKKAARQRRQKVMIRIKLEGNNWNEIVEQLRQMVGDDTVAPIVGQVTHVCKVVPDEGILTENTSPPVEPVDKGDGVTEFRPVIPDREAVAAVNKPPPPTIPAIDALPQTPTPDVDARGIPWDARIHAGNKATTKAGDWKRRRGVSVEEVQRIEAELKIQYPNPRVPVLPNGTPVEHARPGEP